MELQSVTVIGKRWFNRTFGNTYFSATIAVNGEQVHKIDYAYGYGNHYLDCAFDWLESNGYFRRLHYSNGGHEAAWQVAERLGFKLLDSVADVQRKKDL